MEKKSKVPQIYGYAVCLVAIITFLISFTAIINSIIDARDPLYSGGTDQRLSSFENFKVETLKSGNNQTTYTPDEATLKKMYEDLINQKIKRVEHQTSKSIIVNSILIAMCILLFFFHWIWIRKLNKQEE